MIDRVKIVHPHDWFKGQIGYVVEKIDQHSLSTYVVRFKGWPEKRAYQRCDIEFRSPVKRLPKSIESLLKK